MRSPSSCTWRTYVLQKVSPPSGSSMMLPIPFLSRYAYWNFMLKATAYKYCACRRTALLYTPCNASKAVCLMSERIRFCTTHTYSVLPAVLIQVQDAAKQACCAHYQWQCCQQCASVHTRFTLTASWQSAKLCRDMWCIGCRQSGVCTLYSLAAREQRAKGNVQMAHQRMVHLLVCHVLLFNASVRAGCLVCLARQV